MQSFKVNILRQRMAQNGRKFVRTMVENIIWNLPGGKRNAQEYKDPLDCQSLFIFYHIISDVAKCTTVKNREKAENYKDKYYYQYKE